MALHIGILQTDHVLPEFRAEHGDYTDMFHHLFRAVETDVVFSDYDVQCDVPDDVVCDAYVITGSKASVYEDLPWIPPLVNFLQRVLAAEKKVIGICFGHQLMAHFFGGRTEPAPQGWGVGVHKTQVLQPHAWMGQPPESVSLLCSHKDQVTELPDGGELFLSSEFCPLAGFTMGDQVITVQGHPEFRKAYSNALMDFRQELLGADVYTAGLSSLTQATDELQIARWLLAFVRER